jgi:hypothetical protein
VANDVELFPTDCVDAVAPDGTAVIRLCVKAPELLTISAPPTVNPFFTLKFLSAIGLHSPTIVI